LCEQGWGKKGEDCARALPKGFSVGEKDKRTEADWGR